MELEESAMHIVDRIVDLYTPGDNPGKIKI
jgi:hypothetical protein